MVSGNTAPQVMTDPADLVDTIMRAGFDFAKDYTDMKRLIGDESLQPTTRISQADYGALSLPGTQPYNVVYLDLYRQRRLNNSK